MSRSAASATPTSDAHDAGTSDVTGIRYDQLGPQPCCLCEGEQVAALHMMWTADDGAKTQGFVCWGCSGIPEESWVLGSLPRVVS